MGLYPSSDVLDVIPFVQEDGLTNFFDIGVGFGEGFGGFLSAKIFGDSIDLRNRSALGDDLSDCIAPVAVFLQRFRNLVFVVGKRRFVEDRAFEPCEGFAIKPA